MICFPGFHKLGILTDLPDPGNNKGCGSFFIFHNGAADGHDGQNEEIILDLGRKIIHILDLGDPADAVFRQGNFFHVIRIVAAGHGALVDPVMVRIIIRKETDPLGVAEHRKGQLQILSHRHPIVAVLAVFAHQGGAVQLGHPGRLDRPPKEGAVVDEHRKQLLADSLPIIIFPGQPGRLHRFFPGAVLVIVHQAADGHVRIVRFCGCQQFFKHVRVHPVVTVHESHIGCRGCLRTSLPGGR